MMIVELKRLYAAVDREALKLSSIHRERLQCLRGCAACCVDDISVWEIEAANIQAEHPELLKNEAAHATGACAFLDATGACRIYENRPYVCRTQGLPLRWLDETEAGETVELRDICPLNEAGEPIEELPAEECWTLGEAETVLAQLQMRFNPNEMRRVRLRDLWQQ